MDHSKPRPAFPLSTSAPGVMGRKSAYSGSNTGPAQGNDDSDMLFLRRATTQPLLNTSIRAQEKLLSKLLIGLPFDVRERVSSAINLTMQEADIAKKDLEMSHVEVISLRADLKKKEAAAENLNKLCEALRGKILELEENLIEMKDSMDARQKFVVRNRRSVGRMASTNRMLMDSLDALQMTSGQASSFDQDRLNSPTHKQAASSQSDQLRESLLRASREQFRSIKKIEVMERKIEELKTNLLASEQRNRQLKMEIDELRSHEGVENEKEIMEIIKDGLVIKQKSFGKIDERFKALMARQAIDPMDGILLLRRLMAHIAMAPGNLHLADVSRFIASREVMKIFDLEMICLFVVPGENSQVLHKYTPRSSEPEIIHLDDTKSLVGDVMCYNLPARLNSIGRSQVFKFELDGCPGVITKKCLAVPVYDALNKKMLGAIHMLNKTQPGTIFSEVDELFATILADQVATLISQCNVYQHVSNRATLLSHLLESSLGLYKIVPEIGSLNYGKPLHHADILNAIETVSRETLNCLKVRAFLTSECLGLEEGKLIMLEQVTHRRGAIRRTVHNTQAVSAKSGLAGYCVHSRLQRSGHGSELEGVINPAVDLDSLGMPMVAMPIESPDGRLLGCIEFVPGPHSPHYLMDELHSMALSADHDKVSFQHAVEWLVHQINTPLMFLMQNIGKPPERPASTPTSLKKGAARSTKIGASLKDGFADFANKGTGDFAAVVPASIPEDEGEYLGDPTAASNSQFKRKSTALVPKPGKSQHHIVETLQSIRRSIAESNLKPHKELAKGQEDYGDDEEEDEDAGALMMEELDSLLKHAIAEATQMEDLMGTTKSEATAAVIALETRKSELEEASLRYAKGIAELGDELELAKTTNERLRQEAEAKEKQMVEMHEKKLAQVAEAHSSKREAAEAKHAKELEEITQSAAAMKAELLAKCDAYVQDIDTLSGHLEAATTQIGSHLSSSEHLQQQLTQLQLEGEHWAASNQAFVRQVEELTAAIAQKDIVIGIMQEQLVKMAGENMKTLDQAAQLAAEAKSAATVAGTAVGASQEPKQQQQQQTQPSLQSSQQAAESPREKKSVGPPATPPPLSRKPTATTMRQATPPARQPTPPAAAPAAAPVAAPKVASAAASASAPAAAAGHAVASSTANSSLPHPWEAHQDESGHTYYFNPITGASSWDLPAADATSATSKTGGAFVHAPLEPVRVGDWLQQFDEHGNEYWLHEITGASVWELPEDAASFTAAGAAKGLVPPVASSVSASAGGYTIEL